MHKRQVVSHSPDGLLLASDAQSGTHTKLPSAVVHKGTLFTQVLIPSSL